MTTRSTRWADGATAATIDGRVIGSGEPYLALGWAFMDELGVVDDRVRVIAVVHDCQVIGAEVPVAPECAWPFLPLPSQLASRGQARKSCCTYQDHRLPDRARQVS